MRARPAEGARCRSLGGATGWLCRRFCGRHSAYAKVSFCPAFQGSRFEVQGSKFGAQHKLSEFNSSAAPPPGWSGGTLDKPWTSPGTIEAPQTPVFDQPHLSSSLHPALRLLSHFHADALGDRARLGRSNPAPSPGGRGARGVTKWCAAVAIPKDGWRGRQPRHPRRARSLATESSRLRSAPADGALPTTVRCSPHAYPRLIA